MLGKIITAKMDQKAAKEQLRNANRIRQESIDLAGQMNWEPDYVSDLAKPYQKAQSPVARAFLESLLTGANPSMVSSTRHGAGRLKAGAQARFDAQTGGFDQLLARQRELETQTPWAPNTYGHAPAVYKLPQQTPEPPRTSDGTPVSDIDKNASTPQDAANLSELWGLPQEYSDKLRSGFNQAGSTPEAAAQLAEMWGLPPEYAEQIRKGQVRR